MFKQLFSTNFTIPSSQRPVVFANLAIWAALFAIIGFYCFYLFKLGISKLKPEMQVLINRLCRDFYEKITSRDNNGRVVKSKLIRKLIIGAATLFAIPIREYQQLFYLAFTEPVPSYAWIVISLALDVIWTRTLSGLFGEVLNFFVQRACAHYCIKHNYFSEYFEAEGDEINGAYTGVSVVYDSHQEIQIEVQATKKLEDDYQVIPTIFGAGRIRADNNMNICTFLLENYLKPGNDSNLDGDEKMVLEDLRKLMMTTSEFMSCYTEQQTLHGILFPKIDVADPFVMYECLRVFYKSIELLQDVKFEDPMRTQIEHLGKLRNRKNAGILGKLIRPLREEHYKYQTILSLHQYITCTNKLQRIYVGKSSNFKDITSISICNSILELIKISKSQISNQHCAAFFFNSLGRNVLSNGDGVEKHINTKAIEYIKSLSDDDITDDIDNYSDNPCKWDDMKSLHLKLFMAAEKVYCPNITIPITYQNNESYPLISDQLITKESTHL